MSDPFVYEPEPYHGGAMSPSDKDRVVSDATDVVGTMLMALVLGPLLFAAIVMAILAVLLAIVL